MQNTYAVLPQNGEAQLRIFNGFNCSVTVNGQEVEPLDFWKDQDVSVRGEGTFNINIQQYGTCNYNISLYEDVDVTENQVTCNKYMMRM